MRTFLLLFFVPLAAAAAKYPPTTVDMILEHISERVYYVQGAPGIATDNQGFISNAAAIVTSEGVVIVDTLGSPSLAERLLGLVRAVTDKPVVKVILTQQRTPFHRLDDFQALDIDPYQHKIVVVKIGYLVPELKALAAKSLLALSPGAVNQDITNLPYQHLQRPMYPFDPDMDWELA